ncbi:hypothetical protein Poly30_35740 [Planctomycetes bacterium Poly30]|uniref:Uncharacterized protein n=1 Tax=Saltatorellus ferox TaxID=2528018 RepID=A0A518EVE9_9BACT|nr:hypothetical protein Poly30_35740 [Planctomycetes bacterium Poly30]
MNHSHLPWGQSVLASRGHSVAVLASALFLSAGSSYAQESGAFAPTKAPSAARHAGTYHVVSGTWTRRGKQLGSMARAAGADVIYSNTALSSYFSTAGGTGGFAPNSTNFDEGTIPTTANTLPFAGTVDRDTYTVNGFEIGYCDFGAADTSGWEVSFYESYAPCTANNSPTATIATTGLPAGGQCWIIDIDLTGGQEFQLTGDGGDGFQNDPALDSFGWSYRYIGSDGSGAAGFQLAADPTFTDPGSTVGGGTYYGGPSACANGTTGLQTQDLWWLEDPTNTSTGCYFFGGYSNNNGCGSPFNPFASFYMEIYADAGMGSPIGTTYCMSTPNSTGVMTDLTITGSETVGDDNVLLVGSQMTPGSLGFFITSQTQGFVANPGGSAGNLCVVNNVGRFLQNISQLKNADAMGQISLDTNLGEWSVNNIPISTPPLFYGATAGLTTNFQLWHRDVGGSNFSNGVAVTWQ